MRTIALAPNPNKPDAVRLTRELADWLAERSLSALVSPDVANLIGGSARASSEEDLISADLLVVLGGDGSLLRWNRLAAARGTPILGVNFGQYGFITEIPPEQAKSALEKVLKGQYAISERVVLEAKVYQAGKHPRTYFALNDIVLSKGALARVLKWHTYVNDKFIVAHAADGIIVATPTGSTAYSMSAGGPVVHPDVSVMIITPICPHTLSGRSLVVPDRERIKIVGESGFEDDQMMVTVDGQLGENLQNRDAVEVFKAAFKSRLIQIETDSFYSKLTTRLRWGERF